MSKKKMSVKEAFAFVLGRAISTTFNASEEVKEVMAMASTILYEALKDKMGEKKNED